MHKKFIVMVSLVGALLLFNASGVHTSSPPKSQTKTTNPHISALVVEEYQLFPADKTYDNPCTDDGSCVPDSVYKKRSKWRTLQYPTEPTDSQMADEINKSIASFGYKLIKNKENKYYTLFKADKLLMKNLHHISSISMNKSKTRFFFGTKLYNDMASQDKSALFIDGAFKFLQEEDPSPIGFLKDKILKIKMLPTQHVKVKDRMIGYDSYELYLDDTKIYDFTGLASPEGVIQSLYIYNNHWILEYLKVEDTTAHIERHSHVIIDGKDLNKALGALDIFNYTHLKGKPLYFFRDKKGTTRISHAGTTLRYTYDNIMHYQCCSSSYFNPITYESMISFYAIKKGYLYYVEAGIFLVSIR